MPSVAVTDDRLIIGKITGAHGINGEIKIKPYGEILDAGLKSVFIILGASSTPAEITSLKPYKEGCVAVIAGIKTREAAHSLSGAFMAVNKKSLPKPPKGEYYVHDLIGMEVSTRDGKILGSVTQVLPSGETDILEVTGGEYGETLIPLTPYADAAVNVKEKKITLNIIEGLLAINKTQKKKNTSKGHLKTERGKT